MGALFGKGRTHPDADYLITGTRASERDGEDTDAALGWIGMPPPSTRRGLAGLAPRKSSSGLRSGGSKWNVVRSDVQDRKAFHKLTWDSFKHVCIVGRGTIGTVRLVKLKTNGKYYAIKEMRRTRIARRKAGDRVRRELQVLESCRGLPFVVYIFAKFQDLKRVYFVLEYGVGGELFNRINELGRLSEQSAKFYVAEMALALRSLHDAGIAYRDLKPDNIVISALGHIRLVDFGLAAYVDENGVVQGVSAGGTTQYLAPEITRGQKEPHGLAVDWWSLGVILYELLTGKPPFGDTTKMTKHEVYMRVNKGQIKKSKYVKPGAASLMHGLLNLNQRERYGWTQVKSDAWFSEVSWDDMEALRIRPPFIPSSSRHVADHTHFPNWKEPRYNKSPPLTAEELRYSSIIF
eukprot:g921.t1